MCVSRNKGVCFIPWRTENVIEGDGKRREKNKMKYSQMHLETCPGNRNFQQYFRIIFVFKLLVFVFIIGWLSKPRAPYFFNCELYM